MPEPFNRLVMILRYALPILVTDTQITLSLRVAFFSGLPHLLKRLHVWRLLAIIKI